MSEETCLGARVALLNYVLQALHMPLVAGGIQFELTPYLALLPTDHAGSELEAILTTLAPNGQSNNRKVMTPRPLALERESIMPGKLAEPNWRSNFESEWAMLDDPVVSFEVSAELFRKYAWSVPGVRGEPGVSLYEEFKFLSAVVHASGCAPQPSDQFTLVAGDFPGIQHIIYTITSKGAARSLRGRSFFLQLLGDAAVRGLLAELQLSWLNVVYSAGGNFVLLAGPHVEYVVSQYTEEFNAALLDSFQGDVALCTACQAISEDEFHGDQFDQHWRELKSSLAAAKLRPFAGLSSSAWGRVFGAHGSGTDLHCAVCQYDPANAGELHRRGDDWWCDECLGFEELAHDLARNHAYLAVADWPDETTPSRWQERLYAISRKWYSLHAEPPRASVDYFRLNDTDFLKEGASGFRFIATRTPLDNDGSIREFEELAKASEGIERIGILRMDVDNLGQIFGRYIEPLSLTRISAASSAMSLFFDGWLNIICADVEHEVGRPKSLCADVEHEVGRPKSLYLIYAGGDDLFVVGPWDVMPYLAQRIHDDLAEYVNGNPYVTISAGIAIEDAHFPLYQAAEHAREALDDRAKGVWYGLDGAPREKNAISLLGEVVGWDEGWPQVVRQRDELCELIKDGMPKALVQTIRRVHAQYDAGRKQAHIGPAQLYYGRWMWMQEYVLTRMAERSQKVHDVKNRIKRLQESTLAPHTIRLAGLSARWVDYLIRKQQGED